MARLTLVRQFLAVEDRRVVAELSSLQEPVHAMLLTCSDRAAWVPRPLRLLFLLFRSGVAPQHGHLNDRLQFVSMKWLQNEAVVVGALGAVHGQAV